MNGVPTHSAFLLAKGPRRLTLGNPLVRKTYQLLALCVLLSALDSGAGEGVVNSGQEQVVTDGQKQVLKGVPVVTDGDSIRIGTTRIRIHGIDAPERRQKCQDPNGVAYACGQRAIHAIEKLIGEREVECRIREVDRYGRAVAQCFAGDIDLGAEQVRRGWAFAYRRHARDYVPQEKEASEGSDGIWVGDFEFPWDWRRTNR